MTTDKKIETLKKLLTMADTMTSWFFMCLGLTLLIEKEEITHEEKQILIGELWADRIYDIRTNGCVTPHIGAWYAGIDTDARIRNINYTITRLTDLN